MTTAYVSIGSNIDRKKNITEGLRSLEKQFGTLLLSSVYEYEPVGFSGDTFYNLVASFNSNLDAKSITRQLRDIEFIHGRAINSQKFSARTLDLDLLLFGDAILNEDGLKLPRVDIERYAFVLEPLAEIAPTLKHPVLHISYSKLWQTMSSDNTQARCLNRLKLPF